MNKKLVAGIFGVLLFCLSVAVYTVRAADESLGQPMPSPAWTVPPIESFFKSVSSAKTFHAENVVIVEMRENETFTYSIKLIDKQDTSIRITDVVFTIKFVDGTVIEALKLSGTLSFNSNAFYFFEPMPTPK